jgi:hypothetical protein
MKNKLCNGIFAAFACCVTTVSHADLTINVVDDAGAPVSNFRWLLEEDTSFDPQPGVATTNQGSLSHHASHAPVVATGQSSVSNVAAVPSDRRYVLSVMSGDENNAPAHTLGGANIEVGQEQVTVLLHDNPIETAQISVMVFADNNPINGQIDQPQELGLGAGSPFLGAGDEFSIILFDTADRVLTDAMGNPLGTTYLPNGDVDAVGDGVIRIGACPQPPAVPNPDCGKAFIKNLAPGKYGVQVVPPQGQGWSQTTTIEGSKTIDAWVMSGEPTFFVEFGGPATAHASFGFVRSFDNLPAPAAGETAGTLNGTIVSIHNSRPPEVTFHDGAPIPSCRVGLNSAGGVGTGVYSAACDADSNFSIAGVAPGLYQLVVWDDNMDVIFGRSVVQVNADGSCNDKTHCNLGNVGVFPWFGRTEHYVFFDTDEDGFPDPGEQGLAEQNINLRFRDGSIYQAFPTDLAGYVPFDEVFPFFKWLVAEVDFLRYKATGLTTIVDAGGEIPAAIPSEFAALDEDLRQWEGTLNPQQQCRPNLDVSDNTNDANGVYGDCVSVINPNTGDNLSSTETGEVLTQGFQSFLGQTQVFYWGKKPYSGEENGGVSGVVVYATTRAEDDPRYAAAEEWEPGIPRVPVNLYVDGDIDKAPYGWASNGAKGPEDVDWNGDGIYQGSDGQIDDIDASGGVTLADVDHYPFGNFPGSEDTDHNSNGQFDSGDAIQISSTDSYDDSLPTGCPRNPISAENPAGAQAPFHYHGDASQPAADCFEGLRTFGQARPAVFDGGYAFTSYVPGGVSSGNAEVEGLPPTNYIVEAKTPTGYLHVKEEDRNVDFGEDYTPNPDLLPPVCVGDVRTVPANLSLFPGEPVGSNFGGTSRPLCDRKIVQLSGGQNAAADFFMFTEVPKSAQAVGLVLDDLANEFVKSSPSFGEKFAPPWLPVSVRDFSGHEVARTYTDEYGLYNVRVPSSFTINAPTPTGVSPNMLTMCLNDPGPIKNPAYTPGGSEPEMITDPNFRRNYTQFCWTQDFWPGKTTYLDTPVLPIAAFAGQDEFPLDCEMPDGAPAIHSVSGPVGGPFVNREGDGTAVAGQTLTIVSQGMQEVDNPAYNGAVGSPQTIDRNFGFGSSKPLVTIGGNAVPAANITAWDNDSITLTVPDDSTGGVIHVENVDTGMHTRTGVNLHVGTGSGNAPIVVNFAAGDSIQSKIDSAAPGDLILVSPGVYNEYLIVSKQISLQGWGAGSTVINPFGPVSGLDAWRAKFNSIINPNAGGDSDFLLDGQPVPDTAALPDGFMQGEELAGILVLAKPGQFTASSPMKIDGLTVMGGNYSGGIVLNGNARYTEITNNVVIGNQGSYGGGIRSGHPLLVDPANTVRGNMVDAQNDNVVIRYNQVRQNGSLIAGAGGIALFTGSDNYVVSDNRVCGNFSQAGGGGITHSGVSHDGLIADNTILFNESFNQGLNVHGGGILLAGTGQPLENAGQVNAPIGAGTGNITISGNLIQGNLAGAGEGGGIRAQFINGTEAIGASPNPYRLDIVNNIVVNNGSGDAGAGMSFLHAVNAHVINNTIAHNDSYGTAATAFAPGVLTESRRRPSGIVAWKHIGNEFDTLYERFSDVALENNIIWRNRSFNWIESIGLTPVIPGSAPLHWDLEVLGANAQLTPKNSLLTALTPFGGPDDYSDPAHGNIAANPEFVIGYHNAGREIVVGNAVGPVATAAAFDEGGNFIDISFGPITPWGDYHIANTSPAIDAANNALAPAVDIDKDVRPTGTGSDMGADENQNVAVADTDGDGLTDDVDNCIEVANADQRDTDGDNFGNMCDGDLNNDGIVSITDFVMFRSVYGSTGPGLDADFNGDNAITITDFVMFRSMYGKPPGPSGVAN